MSDNGCDRSTAAALTAPAEPTPSGSQVNSKIPQGKNFANKNLLEILNSCTDNVFVDPDLLATPNNQGGKGGKRTADEADFTPPPTTRRSVRSMVETIEPSQGSTPLPPTAGEGDNSESIMTGISKSKDETLSALISMNECINDPQFTTLVKQNDKRLLHKNLETACNWISRAHDTLSKLHSEILSLRKDYDLLASNLNEIKGKKTDNASNPPPETSFKDSVKKSLLEAKNDIKINDVAVDYSLKENPDYKQVKTKLINVYPQLEKEIASSKIIVLAKKNDKEKSQLINSDVIIKFKDENGKKNFESVNKELKKVKTSFNMPKNAHKITKVTRHMLYNWTVKKNGKILNLQGKNFLIRPTEKCGAFKISSKDKEHGIRWEFLGTLEIPDLNSQGGFSTKHFNHIEVSKPSNVIISEPQSGQK